MNDHRKFYKNSMAVIIPVLVAALLAAGVNVFANTADPQNMTAEEKGLLIATESDRRDTGWKDMKADVTMHLVNRQGETSSRKLRIKSLEQENDGDKSLVVFDEPRDVKGTALLSYTHCLKPDDQWLFLPALKRIKRISTANKSGPFLGSEFAYEDMASQEIEKYTYSYLRNEKLNGLECFVLERYPVYSKSGYTKQTVWCDCKEYRLMKVAFFDRKKELLKTLTYSGYGQYLDKYWRPEKMHMVNHQTGKSTSLIWNDYRFNNNFALNDFSRNSLKRVR